MMVFIMLELAFIVNRIRHFLNEKVGCEYKMYIDEDSVDLAAILKELKGDNMKNRKNDWLPHSNVTAVGFLR